MHFAQKVDRRSRQAMVDFLSGHARYWTMSSVNRLSSYAHCVKVHRLGLTAEQANAAYELLGAEDGMDFVSEGIADFTHDTGYEYTIGQNGRSGGYLVLYGCRREDSGYRSHCRTCHQVNYSRVAPSLADGLEAVVAKELLASRFSWRDEVYLQQPAIAERPEGADLKLEWIRRLREELKDSTPGNRCGRCGAEGEKGRFNLSAPHYQLRVSQASIDAGADFTDRDEWSLESLRWRVDLICQFDKACDSIRDRLLDTIGSCQVVEKTIMVPKTVRVLECRA